MKTINNVGSVFVANLLKNIPLVNASFVMGGEVVVKDNHEVLNSEGFGDFIRTDDGSKEICVHGMRTFLYKNKVVAIVDDRNRKAVISRAGVHTNRMSTIVNSYKTFFMFQKYSVIIL